MTSPIDLDALLRSIDAHQTRGWEHQGGCSSCAFNSHLCIDAMKDLREASAAIRALRAENASLSEQVDQGHQIALDVMRERDEARADCKAYDEKLNETIEERDRFMNALADTQDERDELRENFLRYAEHDLNCGLAVSTECTCGLDWAYDRLTTSTASTPGAGNQVGNPTCSQHSSSHSSPAT